MAVELLVMNIQHSAHLLFGARCVPLGGGPRGDLVPPARSLPAALSRHVSSLLDRLPCNAGYAGHVLYAIRTFAFADPWVRIVLFDDCNLVLSAVQLIVLAVALTFRHTYERRRSALLVVTLVAPVLASLAAAARAPGGLLAIGGAGFLGPTARQRMLLAAFTCWKSIVVLRLPSRVQLLAGPITWLLVLAACNAVGRRLREPADDGRAPAAAAAAAAVPMVVLPAEALLHFAVIALVPYAAAVLWERVSLRPQYRQHCLRLQRGDGHCGGGPAAAANVVAPGDHPCGPDAPSAGCGSPRKGPGVTECARRPYQQPARWLPAVGPLSPHSPAPRRLYSSCLSTMAVSVKVQLPPGCSYELEARRVHDAAVAAVRASARIPGFGPTAAASIASEGYDSAATPLAAPHQHAAVSGALTSEVQLGEGAAHLQLVSAACVRGCVQLLLVLRSRAAAAAAAAVTQSPRSLWASHRRGIHTQMRIPPASPQPAPSGGATSASAGGGSAGGGVGDGVLGSLEESLRLLIATAVGTAAGPMEPPMAAPASEPFAMLRAALWPPALPLARRAAAAEASAAAAGSAPAAAVVALLLLPLRLVPASLTAVRCVLVGAKASGGSGSDRVREAVLMDEELQLTVLMGPAAEAEPAEAQAQTAAAAAVEPEAALAVVRVAITPPMQQDAAMGSLLTLHVLLPQQPPGSDSGSDSGSGSSRVHERSGSAPSPDPHPRAPLTPAPNAPGAAPPLAVLPLLLLPAEAATELRHLHEELIGADAAGMLNGMLEAAAAAAAEPSANEERAAAGFGAAVTAAAVVGHGDGRQREVLSEAVTDIADSGLQDLAFDFGSLVDGASPPLMPPPRCDGSNALGGLGDGAAAIAAAPAEASHMQPLRRLAATNTNADDDVEGRAGPYGELLRLLARRRMTACLREALRTLGLPAAPPAEAAAGAAAQAPAGREAEAGPEADAQQRLEAIVLGLFARYEPPPPSRPSEAGDEKRALECGARVGRGSSAASGEGCAGGGGEGGGSGGRVGQQTAEQTAELLSPPLPPSAPPPSPLLSHAHTPWLPACCLWACLRGFEPPCLEASYQAFKAAQCAGLDLTGLLLVSGIRAATIARTYREAAERRPLGARWRLQLASQLAFLAPMLSALLLRLVMPSSSR
ncbi:hypothetical protein GPECTOR_8g7 [Gonium pectorale]|uniref:Uncharacterized protein n=1 Tax=Gonium pectorale TaxID=33097 RepID=A0A150GT92_GONPE|nr:hypothetical protein GPECTOR_8g7 [Gonium pectorale]|eukprot:KXZ53077.1 hypothetical protein GPECTOR_8g7 [Gonium pectorale]